MTVFLLNMTLNCLLFLKDLFFIEFLWRIEKFEDKQDGIELYEVEKILFFFLMERGYSYY